MEAIGEIRKKMNRYRQEKKFAKSILQKVDKKRVGFYEDDYDVVYEALEMYIRHFCYKIKSCEEEIKHIQYMNAKKEKEI